jgi:fumarate reductase subunit D
MLPFGFVKFFSVVYSLMSVDGLIEGYSNLKHFLQLVVIEIFLLTTTILACFCAVHMLVTITAFSSAIRPEMLDFS